ncbi:uncharacterized protein LOC106668631 [Cimex lectularius]|uniref:Uncharacterized protein n=1 Tax=Cimex lectularius TaxID=79782 RepID=A0A8I6RZK2_CIMLE|nr:uncharacterized protein LOC106668631 [Cimex lectularius]
MEMEVDGTINTERSLSLIGSRQVSVTVQDIEATALLLRVIKGRILFLLSKNNTSNSTHNDWSSVDHDSNDEVSIYLLKVALKYMKRCVDTHPALSNFLWQKIVLNESDKAIVHKQKSISKDFLLEQAVKEVVNLAVHIYELMNKKLKQSKKYMEVVHMSWQVQSNVNQVIPDSEDEESDVSEKIRFQKSKGNALRRVKRLGEIIQRLLVIYPVDYKKNEPMRTILKRLVIVDSM